VSSPWWSEVEIVVVTDGDLVFKLLSLPSEAREELLSLLGEAETRIGPDAGQIVMERLHESSRRDAPESAN
jgi:hypothetical protein